MGGDTALVGRDGELARVTGLLDDALAGRGRLVLCTGEAGIGKTRLAEELAAAATARDVPVAWARAADRVARRRTACGGWSWTSPPSAVALRRIAGPVVARLRRPPTPALAAPIRASRSGSRCSPTCADGWRRRPSGTGCCWCSTTCSGRTRRRRPCSPMSSASSAGPGSWSSPPTGPRRRARGSCSRLSAEANTERVDLHGLPAEAVGDLLLAAGLDASPEQARRVHAETGGNPFLVRELAQTLTGPPGPPVRPCRDGCSTPRPTGSPSCRTRPGRCCRQPRWRATASRSAWWPRMLDVPVLSLLGPLEECTGGRIPGRR